MIAMWSQELIHDRYERLKPYLTAVVPLQQFINAAFMVNVPVKVVQAKNGSTVFITYLVEQNGVKLGGSAYYAQVVGDGLVELRLTHRVLWDDGITFAVILRASEGDCHIDIGALIPRQYADEVYPPRLIVYDRNVNAVVLEIPADLLKKSIAL